MTHYSRCPYYSHNAKQQNNNTTGFKKADITHDSLLFAFTFWIIIAKPRKRFGENKWHWRWEQDARIEYEKNAQSIINIRPTGLRNGSADRNVVNNFPPPTPLFSSPPLLSPSLTPSLPPLHSLLTFFAHVVHNCWFPFGHSNSIQTHPPPTSFTWGLASPCHFHELFTPSALARGSQVRRRARSQIPSLLPLVLYHPPEEVLKHNCIPDRGFNVKRLLYWLLNLRQTSG